MGFRVEQHKDECIGCAACVSACESFWEMKDDNKAHIIGGQDAEGNVEFIVLDELDCNQDAADICPVQCIKIIEQ